MIVLVVVTAQLSVNTVFFVQLVKKNNCKEDSEDDYENGTIEQLLC